MNARNFAFIAPRMLIAALALVLLALDSAPFEWRAASTILDQTASSDAPQAAASPADLASLPVMYD